jgi:putative nucleotidyltransferase with HDIG domain
VAAVPPGRELAYHDLPAPVRTVLGALADAGHEAALVGGSVRDRLLGLTHGGDWDVATAARPEEVASLFPGATWENRFGTVTVGRDPAVEVTSYRTEAAYRDRRRPDEVRFGVSLADDLARRDFTINAVAWLPEDLAAGRGRIVDLHGGAGDLEARILRTVGEPRERFGEDALRLIRAVRFASRFDLRLDPGTEAAIVELAPTAATVSAERVRDELSRILRLDPFPSRALRLLERLGLLRVILPELTSLRGIPQAKAVAGDALDHTLAAVDAAPAEGDASARWAALLHDLGKASTLADGHFIGHETVGAELARSAMERLRLPRGRSEAIAGAIEHHMYHYEPDWTDAAVRRFIRRTDDIDRELLFALRRADNAASGAGTAGEENQAELERRVAAALHEQPDLLRNRRLAIDGNDLQAELGLEPGPEVGRILGRLADRALDDPSVNERPALLALAREIAAER